MTIPTVKLNDGRQAPRLAFGTGTALYGKDTISSVVQAIETGYHHIDAAEVYANEEESTGQAIAQSKVPREQLYIVSKANPLVDDCDVRRSITGTLKNLGVTYLDLYLLHAPPQSAVKRTGNGDADIAKQWAELEALQAEGLVKSIGVSNYRVKDLETLLKTAKVIPAVNQIEFHPLVLKAAEPLLELQKKHDILTENYGGLGTLTWGKGTEVDGVVSRIAQETGRTEGQVLLKWLLQTHGGIAVTTSSKKERLIEHLEALEKSDLSTEDVAAISEAGRKHHNRKFMKHMDD